jgi:transposase
MGDITTIGLDLAKSVFQVYAVNEMGSVVMRKRLRRSQVLAFFAEVPPCLIGLEACATVVGLKRHSRTVMVRFDGNRTTNTPHRDYIEPVEA